MRTISILIPTCNEEDNIRDFAATVVNIVTSRLSNYDYEVLIIDNASTDNTPEIIRELCSENKKIKAILNAKNYGTINSSLYGMLHSSGDATIFIPADFQDPPELIEDFVREWENGAEVVLGQKNASKTNPIMHFFRGIYYKTINRMSDTDLLEQCTDFGLFDRAFINVLRDSTDNQPYIRGMVAKYAKKISLVDYVQQKRRKGKSKFNLYKLYDYAMIGFTSQTKVGLRLALFVGIIIAILSFIIGIVYLVLKIMNWDAWTGATIPTLIGVFFIGGAQLVFLGFIGEYILSINNRLVKHPLVRERERLNFDNEEIDKD